VRGGLSLLSALATGCALAPGMRMDQDAVEARGRANTKNGEYRVEPITPVLLAKLLEQGARENKRLVDPEGPAALAPYTVAPYVPTDAHPHGVPGPAFEGSRFKTTSLGSIPSPLANFRTVALAPHQAKTQGRVVRIAPRSRARGDRMLGRI